MQREEERDFFLKEHDEVKRIVNNMDLKGPKKVSRDRGRQENTMEIL